MRIQANISRVGSLFGEAREAVRWFVVGYCGLVFYLVAFVLNLFAVVFRWYLVYLSAVFVELLVSVFDRCVGVSLEVPAGVSVALACAGAFLPCLWSASAFFWQAGAAFCAWRLDARRPSLEEEQLWDQAVDLLRSAGARIPRGLTLYVIDDQLPSSFVRCGAIFMSRELIRSEFLPAAIAHELGHVVSFDSRLTEALNRLMLWNDPLRLEEFEPRGSGGAFVWGFVRWFVRLAGGTFFQRLLSPVLFWYWREREYVADDGVVLLGQAEGLVGLLEMHRAFDFSQPRRFVNWDSHPPIELRIERLRLPLE